MNLVNKTIPLHQKFFLILFGLFLTILILEIGLRVSGFAILSLQEHRNLRAIKQKGTFRIMCLGESTTQRQYAPFLEEILNQRRIGTKFVVIDKALAGAQTTALLSNLEVNLDKYKPDMVVAMMGINDTANSESKMILTPSPFRVYKIGEFIWLHVAAKFKRPGFYAQDINKQKNPSKKERWMLQQKQALKKAIELDPNHDRLYGSLAIMYCETGNRELCEIYTKKADILRARHLSPFTVNNHRFLKRILDKRKIKLVSVQYPVRNLELLKEIFTEEMKDSIIFVDNEKIFKDGIRKNGYNEYFIDMFGGDFGHCSPRGNRLLAENIANAILKEYFNK